MYRLNCENTSIVIILLFISALSIKLAYIFFFVGFNTPPYSDCIYFDKVAQNIAQGKGFVLEDGMPTARKTPVFPIFLGLIYRIFGHSYPIARFFQLVIASLIPVIMYLITKDIFNKNIAFIAGLLAVLDPVLIFFSGVFFSEVLLTLITLIFTLVLIKETNEPKIKNAVFAGILLALSIHTRPLFVFMLLLIFPWKLIVTNDYKKSIIFGTLTVITSIIVMMPWTIRNYLIYKKFVPITTTVGLTAWLSNDPSSGGFIRSQSATPRRFLTKEDLGDEFNDYYPRREDNLFYANMVNNEKEVDDMFLKMFLEKMEKDPFIFINLIPKKIIAFWDGFHIFSHFSTVVIKKRIIVALSYAFIFPFALVGVKLTKQKWREISIFYLLILSMNFMAIFFHADYRFRLAAMPYFMILAAVTYNWILIKFLSRRDHFVKGKGCNV